MDSPLVPVFLAVIAVVALMQAAFVAGLAIAMRTAGRKLAEVEETLLGRIEAQAATLTRLSEAAARASEQTLEQAERMESVVSDASEKVERVMSAVTRKLESAAGDVEETADDLDREPDPISGRLAGAAALFRGVQRAMEVWRETAPTDGPGRRR